MFYKERGAKLTQQADIRLAVELLPETVQDTLLSSSAFLYSDAMGAFLDNYVKEIARRGA